MSAPFHIRFTLSGPPMAWARAGRNKPTGKTFTKNKQSRQKASYGIACKNAMIAAGGVRPAGRGSPVHMMVLARFAVPPSLTKAQRGRRLTGAGYHTQKPDADNIVKLIKDALNGIAYVDDCQIATHSVSKFWVSDPQSEGVTVVLTSPDPASLF